jgi:hypothetical protein
MTKSYKVIVIAILTIVCSLVIGLILRQSLIGPSSSGSDKDLIRETIQDAWLIQLEAEYTFDTSKLSTVYINDPRGRGITDEALDQIREIRNDHSIQKDEVGILDYSIAIIDKIHQEYDSYIDDLRAKEAAGTLATGDKLILAGETYGWPTRPPEIEDPVQMATQACELFQTQVMESRKIATAMPSPLEYTGYSTAYPEPLTPSALPATSTPSSGTPYPPPTQASTAAAAILCPTSIPTPLPIHVPYRGVNPATLSPEDLQVEFISIEINHDVARVIVHIRAVTSEYILVKTNGHWYIAGASLVKVEV